MTWAQQAANVNAAIVDPRHFGVTATYSRPASGQFSPIAPFALSVSIETGRGYEDPTTPLYGEVGIQQSAVPLGPQKGDLIVLANPTPLLPSGTYAVHEIYSDDQTGWCRAMIRWTGQ